MWRMNINSCSLFRKIGLLFTGKSHKGNYSDDLFIHNYGAQTSASSSVSPRITEGS